MEIGRAVKTLRRIAQILRGAGVMCMGIAVLGGIFIYVPLGMAEIKYAWGRTNAGREISRIDRNLAIGKIQEKKVTTAVAEEKPEWTVPDENYSIYIPKIEAVSRVIPG